MKKLLVGLLSLVLIFCVGCSGKNPNDIFSSESSNKKDESVIDTPDPEESTDSEDISKEEDSSDDTSSTEKEDEKDDNSSKEEPPQKEGNDWTFIY